MNISLLRSIIMEFPQALINSFFCEITYLWLVDLGELHHSQFQFSFGANRTVSVNGSAQFVVVYKLSKTFRVNGGAR